MKIGFIGTHPMLEQLFHIDQKGYDVVGVYSHASPDSLSGVRIYSTARALVQESDVIFMGQTAPAPFETGKLAVKESRHLFLESPFTLEAGQLDELYGLAAESRSMVKLNQRLLHHPVYKHLEASLHPGQIFIRVDAVGQSGPNDKMHELWFELSALLCHTIPSGIRRTGSHVVIPSSDLEGPVACQAHVDFDNGASAMVLVNHLAEGESLQAEFFQQEGRYLMDFYTGKALSFRSTDSKAQEVEKKSPSWHSLTVEAFRAWTTAANNGKLPLTINEQGQAVYHLASQLLDKLQQRRRLLV
jgi:predicted dehydrogenase